MLDLTVLSQKVAQGRSTAEMTLATPRPAEATTVSDGAAPAEPGATEPAAPAPVDPRAVAREVYRLMRQDLALRRERRGGGV
jgi:hypothetical protein